MTLADSGVSPPKPHGSVSHAGLDSHSPTAAALTALSSDGDEKITIRGMLRHAARTRRRLTQCGLTSCRPLVCLLRKRSRFRISASTSETPRGGGVGIAIVFLVCGCRASPPSCRLTLVQRQTVWRPTGARHVTEPMSEAPYLLACNTWCRAYETDRIIAIELAYSVRIPSRD